MEKMDRREFFKWLGISALSFVAAKTEVLGYTQRGVVVDSPSEYGGFLVEKLTRGKPYEVDLKRLRRMSEKFTLFSRNLWDPSRQNRPELRENLMYERLIKKKGREPNYTRLDYAFMAASWFVAQTHGGTAYSWEGRSPMIRFFKYHGIGPWNPAEIDMSWEDATLAIKHAALFYGASLVGVAELNPLWIYSEHYAPTRENRERTIPIIFDDKRFERTEEAWYIPRSMNRVIVLAFEEDFYAIANSPGQLASAAVGNGYSRMAFTAGTLAEFIRCLGYRAIPAGNGVGLSIPMAVDAGLGQVSRAGILITPKFGPRVRLAKVITDMPLVPDSPIDFGVTEFCEVCKLCAEHCPSGAITSGPRSWEGKSPSNNPGVFKWYIEPEKCYDFNNFSCSNCKRVCPFTKPNNSWLHRMIRQIIKARIKPLNSLMVRLDQTSGYGRQLQDRDFWKMKGDKSITARDPE